MNRTASRRGGREADDVIGSLSWEEGEAWRQGGRRPVPGPQRPLKAGFRFSMKAVWPSL